MADQCAKAQLDECLPGSSEVIESLFGRFKAREREYASQGFTSLLLGLPALVGPHHP